MKTIIVDDEKWILEQFEDDSRDIPGIELVGKFRDPAQAIEYARVHDVELALLDIEMPGMNGLELSSKLRELDPKLIVIFVSAYDGYMPDAFRKQNADYFLVKPYSHSDLESAIERALLLSGRLRKQILIQTFGSFKIVVNNEAVQFEQEKAKELLALLVDARGQPVATNELAQALCPGKTVAAPIYQKALRCLQETLKQHRITDLVQLSNGKMWVQIENVDCDLMSFEYGNAKTIQSFDGCYMNEYPWAEHTREQLQKQLSLYERYRDDSIQNSLCAIIRCRWDDDLTLEYVNDSFLAITGYTRDEISSLLSNSLRKLIVPEDWSSVQAAMQQQLQHSEFKEIEYRVRCKNGDTLWVLDKGRLSVLKRNGKTIREFECMLMDISAYKSKMTELKQRREQDALTKLYTRGTAQEMIEQYLATKPPEEKCAMLLLDVDNFKQVNDTYGHPFADTVLTDIAAIINRSFRSDDITGRLGGDEMIVFLPNIPDMTFLRGRIASFYAALRKRLLMKTSAGEIACSMGAAIGPEDGNTFEALYREADIALYYSKRNGKGCATLRQDVQDTAIQTPVDDHIGEDYHIRSFVEYMRQQLAQAESVPDTIDAILSILGQQLEASRVYIFEGTTDHCYIVNTFEWCAEDCAPEIDNLQMLPYEYMEAYMQMLRMNDGLFNIYDISTMGAETYALLEPQGIRSMLHTELVDENGNCFGFLGVDECRRRKYWSGLQCMTLKTCGQEIGKTLSLYRGKTNIEQLQAFVASRKRKVEKL